MERNRLGFIAGICYIIDGSLKYESYHIYIKYELT